MPSLPPTSEFWVWTTLDGVGCRIELHKTDMHGTWEIVRFVGSHRPVRSFMEDREKLVLVGTLAGLGWKKVP